MKFSIVTPSFNAERFIREAIESVLSQEGDFEIEYRVVDGGSTDSTVEILRDYEQRLQDGSFPIRCRAVRFQWLSEPDQGMYDAINKGFGRATGDIQAWINTDDFYLPGAFETIRKVFETYPEIEWLKGITSYTDASSRITDHGRCNLYWRDWIRAGIYGRDTYFIQQDSVFWRASLWGRAGPVDSRLRLAGDYQLWTRFAAHAPLVSLNVPLSCFRRVEGQLSQDLARYMREARSVSPPAGVWSAALRLYFRIAWRIPRALARASCRAIFPKHVFSLVERTESGDLHLREAHYFEQDDCGRSDTKTVD